MGFNAESRNEAGVIVASGQNPIDTSSGNLDNFDGISRVTKPLAMQNQLFGES